MEIGLWWYVYPREATAAAFLVLGLFPDLPKSALLRAAFLVALAIPLHRIGALVERDYGQFDTATADFDAVVAHLPKAPKLLYLIFDHGGSRRANTPFIHLPAYVQATKGGWLSFHFASWGASPMVYRDPTAPLAVVPPPVPLRWEWRPQIFDAKKNGAFFDWFLVRDAHLPDRWFRADPSIHKVEHVGEWWLYGNATDDDRFRTRSSTTIEAGAHGVLSEELTRRAVGDRRPVEVECAYGLSAKVDSAGAVDRADGVSTPDVSSSSVRDCTVPPLVSRSAMYSGIFAPDG